jgi:hypothetical protein
MVVGNHPQTVLFPLDEPSSLRSNLDVTAELLDEIAPSTVAHGGRMAYDVNPETIARYLEKYITHEEAVSFRPAALGRWIRSRADAGELLDWTVFVASPDERQAVMIGGHEFGLVHRSRISSHSIGALIDPRHEGVDLPGGPSGYRRRGGSADAEAMRRARAVTRGLLMVYPLDPGPLGMGGKISSIIGLALSLPFTTDVTAKWVVNVGVADG